MDCEGGEGREGGECEWGVRACVSGVSRGTRVGWPQLRHARLQWVKEDQTLGAGGQGGCAPPDRVRHQAADIGGRGGGGACVCTTRQKHARTRQNKAQASKEAAWQRQRHTDK